MWSWDWANWENFPRSQEKDVAEPGVEPSYPKMQPREFHKQPSYAVSTLLSSTSFSPNNYSSWQMVDVCFEQHWARTGYRNIRSSYWLGSNWGGKKDISFSSDSLQGLHAESILTVLFTKQSVASLQRRNCWSAATNRQSHWTSFILY